MYNNYLQEKFRSQKLIILSTGRDISTTSMVCVSTALYVWQISLYVWQKNPSYNALTSNHPLDTLFADIIVLVTILLVYMLQGRIFSLHNLL